MHLRFLPCTSDGHCRASACALCHHFLCKALYRFVFAAGNHGVPRIPSHPSRCDGLWLSVCCDASCSVLVLMPGSWVLPCPWPGLPDSRKHSCALSQVSAASLGCISPSSCCSDDVRGPGQLSAGSPLPPRSQHLVAQRWPRCLGFPPAPARTQARTQGPSKVGLLPLPVTVLVSPQVCATTLKELGLQHPADTPRTQ